MDTGLDGRLPGFPFCSGSSKSPPINPSETWAASHPSTDVLKLSNDNIPRHSIHLFNVGNDDNDQEDRSVEWPSRRNQVRHPQGRHVVRARRSCVLVGGHAVLPLMSPNSLQCACFSLLFFISDSNGSPIDGQSPIQRDARQLSGLCAVIVLSIHPRIGYLHQVTEKRRRSCWRSERRDHRVDPADPLSHQPPCPTITLHRWLAAEHHYTGIWTSHPPAHLRVGKLGR